MLWGYAGLWPREFTGGRGIDLGARLEFLVEWGLQCTGMIPQMLDAMGPERTDSIFSYLAEHDLHLSFASWGGIFVDDDAAKRHREELLASIERHKDDGRAVIVTTAAGSVHRFQRDPPLERQLDILTERLIPLAAGVNQLGLKLGIENHGDYYISDLVELCSRVPDLYLFLDTGNTYLIGEAAMPAIRAAAPYTIGTHFKDHHVRPRLDTNPLQFEIGAAVLGEGDVGLGEAYAVLLEHAPDPENLVMELELIPPKDQDPVESLRKSLEFIHSLPSPQAMRASA